MIVDSGKGRIFCAGANIGMLGQATHEHKVNFCKFTNETRLAIEDASANSGQRYLCAVSGTAAGGGYELALATDWIVLADDGNSAISLPEVPLLGVLPGTGGLTRLVDKRKVRRDRADVFCTLEEGVKGQRALEWNLVDELASRTKFEEVVKQRALEMAAKSDRPAEPGIALEPLEREITDAGIEYSHLRVELDRELGTAQAGGQGSERGSAGRRRRRCAPPARGSGRSPWRASSTTRSSICASTRPGSACSSSPARATSSGWRRTTRSSPPTPSTGWRARSCSTGSACSSASISRRARCSR